MSHFVRQRRPPTIAYPAMTTRHSFIFAATLAFASLSHAADPVKFDVLLGGQLKQSVTLQGPNATARFSPHEMPGTTLEIRLIAPEPLILEMKETDSKHAAGEATGRIKLATSGSSVAVADLKGSHFQHPYVLVRKD